MVYVHIVYDELLGAWFRCHICFPKPKFVNSCQHILLLFEWFFKKIIRMNSYKIMYDFIFMHVEKILN